MNLSLLPQQCPACLVRLTWVVFVMCGKWPFSCYFVGCNLQDLNNIARSTNLCRLDEPIKNWIILDDFQK